MRQNGDPSFGLMLHELLHCTKAQEQRLFLAKNAKTRSLLFSALQQCQAFTSGVLAGEQQPDAATFAQLFAILISRICSSGAEAHLALLEHVRQHSTAYARLLAPYSQADLGVRAALHTLLGCIPTEQDDGQLFSAGDREKRGNMRHACDRLCFVAEFLSQAWQAAADSEQQLSSELVSAGLASLFNGIAMVERAVREKVEGALRKPGKDPPSKASQATIEKRVRKELPHDVIQRALVVTALFPPVALQGLFQLTSLQDEPVLVLLLRLELLWDRLPAGKRAELSVLPCLLHNAGVQLATDIRSEVEAALAHKAGSTKTRRLRDLLSILRAVLRASDRAAALGLLKPKQAEQLTNGFASAVLFDSTSSTSTSRSKEPEAPASDGKQPVFWLLWHLLASSIGASSTAMSTNALCKASNVLSWVFSSSQPAVVQHVASHVVTSGLLERILASTSAPLLNPFCREVCRAIMSAWSMLKDLPRLPPPVAESLDQLKQLDREQQAQHATWSAGSALALATARADGQHPGIKDLDTADGLPSTSMSVGGSSSTTTSSRPSTGPGYVATTLPSPNMASPDSTRSSGSTSRAEAAVQNRAGSGVPVASCCSSAGNGSGVAGQGAASKQPGPGGPGVRSSDAVKLLLLKQQLAKRQAAKKQQQQQEKQEETMGSVQQMPEPPQQEPTVPEHRPLAVPDEQQATLQQISPAYGSHHPRPLNPHAPQWTPQQLQQHDQQQQHGQQGVEKHLCGDPCSLPHSCTQKQAWPPAPPPNAASRLLQGDEHPSQAPSLDRDGLRYSRGVQPASEQPDQPCQQGSLPSPGSSGTPCRSLSSHAAEVAFTAVPCPPPLNSSMATSGQVAADPAHLPPSPVLHIGESLSGISRPSTSTSSGSGSSVDSSDQDTCCSSAAVAELAAGLSQLSIDSPAQPHTPTQPQPPAYHYLSPPRAPPPQEVPVPPAGWRETPPHIPHRGPPPGLPLQPQLCLQSTVGRGGSGGVEGTAMTAAQSQGSGGTFFDHTINALQCRSAQPGAASPTLHGQPSNSATNHRRSDLGWSLGSDTLAVHPAHVAFTASPTPSLPSTSTAPSEQKGRGATPLMSHPTLQGQLQPGNTIGNQGGSSSSSSNSGGGAGVSSMDIDDSTAAAAPGSSEEVTAGLSQVSLYSPSEMYTPKPTQRQPPAYHAALPPPSQAAPVTPVHGWESPLDVLSSQVSPEVQHLLAQQYLPTELVLQCLETQQFLQQQLAWQAAAGAPKLLPRPPLHMLYHEQHQQPSSMVVNASSWDAAAGSSAGATLQSQGSPGLQEDPSWHP